MGAERAGDTQGRAIRTRAEQEAEIAAERKSQVGSGDRSGKIRTYNFPQSRVTDHRIGLTVHSLDAIMAGNLDEVVDAILDWRDKDDLARALVKRKLETQELQRRLESRRSELEASLDREVDVETFFDEVDAAWGTDRRLDAAITRLKDRLTRSKTTVAEAEAALRAWRRDLDVDRADEDRWLEVAAACWDYFLFDDAIAVHTKASDLTERQPNFAGQLERLGWG